MFRQSLWQVRAICLTDAAIGNRGILHSDRLAVLCVVLLLGSAGVLAQEPATSLDQLHLLLAKGDRITLVDPSGSRTTGRVDRLAPDGMDLKVSGQVRTFQAKDIGQITRKKPDSPLNGFLIGFGAGFGATLPLNLGLADSNEKPEAVVASVLWGFIGGGIGALVDASIHETQMVYFRPKSNATWRISPFYSDQPYSCRLSAANARMSDLRPYSGGKASMGLRLTIQF